MLCLMLPFVLDQLFELSDEVEAQPAQYTEIQVNQLSDAGDGFLPPLHATGMYSMVHS